MSAAPDSGQRRRALRWAHLALVVLGLALYGRLFLGEAHVGWDVTSAGSPWGTEPDVWNGLAQDPLVWELSRCLQQEREPAAWNPDLGLGEPAGTFVHPFQGYAPATIAQRALPAWLGRDLLTLAHVLIAGALTLRWLVWRGHGVRAALIGAVAWQLSTVNMVWLEYSQRPALAAWTPLALWAAEALARRARLADAGRLAGALGLALLGGLAEQGPVLLLAACASVVVVQAAPERRARALGLVVLACVGGVALAGVRVIPMAIELAASNRAALPFEGWSERTATLQARHLLTLLAPDLLGSPARDLDLLGLPGQPYSNYAELRLYVGLPALVLAVAGVSRRSGTRGLAALALLAVVAAAPTPLSWLPWALLPGVSASAPARLLWVAHALLPPLVAAGAGRALRGERAVSRVGVAALVAVVALALAVSQPAGAARLVPARSELPPEELRAASTYLAARLDVTARPLELRRAGGRDGWQLSPLLGPLLLAAATAAALGSRRRGAPALLAGLVALDLLGFALAYNPTTPARALFPRTPQLERVAALLAPGQRALGERLLPNLLQPLGLRELGAYNSVRSARSVAFFGAVARPSRMVQLSPTLDLSPAWRDVLAVRVVLTRAGVSPSVGLGLGREAAGAGPLAVWANPTAGSRARLFLPSAVARTGGPAGAVALLRAEGFDPRRHVVLERPGPPGALDPGAPPAVDVPLLEDRAERVALEVAAPDGGLLLLADAWDPGWTVQVEGVEAPVAAPADVALRGVELPPGFRGRVTWSYARPGAPLGRALTLLTGLALLVVVGQRRRKAAAWPAAMT